MLASGMILLDKSLDAYIIKATSRCYEQLSNCWIIQLLNTTAVLRDTMPICVNIRPITSVHMISSIREDPMMEGHAGNVDKDISREYASLHRQKK